MYKHVIFRSNKNGDCCLANRKNMKVAQHFASLRIKHLLCERTHRTSLSNQMSDPRRSKSSMRIGHTNDDNLDVIEPISSYL